MTFLSRRILALIIFISVSFLLYVGFSKNSFNSAQVQNQDIGYCINVADETPEEKRVKDIQQQISKIYDKLLQTTVRVEVRNSAASAVLVSTDGYILTAAHVIKAVGDEYANVRLHDGSTYRARCLGANENKDYGLMKIEPKGKLIFSKMGNASRLVKDEACIMFGHPASKEESRPAIGRIGFYKGKNENDFLKTSCIMMPGDSGGPLFNLEGELMGVCSYINKGVEDNFYPSVDNVKKDWDKLIKGEKLQPKKGIDYGTSIQEAPSEEKRYVLKGGKNTLIKVLTNKSHKIKEAVVSIRSSEGAANQLTLGTIIDDNGYVVSKSSEITNDQIDVVLYNGQNVSAKIIGRDKENDIAILKITASKNLKGIRLESPSNIKKGKLLAAVTGSSSINWSGILGLESRKIITNDKGFLGIQLAEQESAVVDYVLQDGAAYKYGIEAQDKIIKFNDSPVSNRQSLRRTLSKTEPDQKVQITVLRDNQEKQISVVLGKKSSHRHRHHPADYTKINKRSDNFPCAFTHDMPLEVSQCGSPVINLEGEVIGINIARQNRTSTLAIPLNHMNKVVKQILKDAESNS
jgi:serine protease Do